MKTLKIAALALGMMMVAGGASAQNCYVGIGVGGSIANMGLADATNALGLPAGNLAVDGLGARSNRPDMGGRVGCDLKLTGPLVLGAFASWTSQDIAFNIQPSLLSVSLGNSWTVGGRAGYQLTSGAMPYVLVGWTQTDVNLGGAGAITLAALEIPDKLQGWKFGGGIEAPLAGTPLKIGVETTWTRFNTERFATGLVDLKTDQVQGMVTLTYQFGASSAPAILK